MFINSNEISLSEASFPSLPNEDTLFQNIFFGNSNNENKYLVDISSDVSSKPNQIDDPYTVPSLLKAKKGRRPSTYSEEQLIHKKMARMEKNRLSAQRSRERKKNELINLQEINKSLLQEIEKLKQEIIEKDKIIALLKKGITDSDSNNTPTTTPVYIDGDSTRTSSPKRNIILFSSAITLICLFVTFTHTAGHIPSIIPKHHIRMLALDNKTNFTFDSIEKFSEKALTGKCLGNDEIKISVKKERNRTGVVPLSFFTNPNANNPNNNENKKENNNIFNDSDKKNVISLYYNETFSSLKNNKQLGRIENIFEQIDNRFSLYQKHNKTPNIRFNRVSRDDCLYIHMIVPVGKDISYEFGCRVFELNKLVYS